MTPKEAYQICLTENKRSKKLQEIIFTDPKWSFYYARYIIGGPWELGEEVISKNPSWSFSYAYEIIKGPFEKCHHIIFNSSWKNVYINFLKSKNYDINKIGEWLI